MRILALLASLFLLIGCPVGSTTVGKACPGNSGRTVVENSSLPLMGIAITRYNQPSWLENGQSTVISTRDWAAAPQIYVFLPPEKEGSNPIFVDRITVPGGKPKACVTPKLKLIATTPDETKVTIRVQKFRINDGSQ